MKAVDLNWFKRESGFRISKEINKRIEKIRPIRADQFSDIILAVRAQAQVAEWQTR